MKTYRWVTLVECSLMTYLHYSSKDSDSPPPPPASPPPHRPPPPPTQSHTTHTHTHNSNDFKTITSYLFFPSKKNNKRVLIHEILSGKVLPSLMANFSLNQSRHSGKLSIQIPWIDIFKSSLIYFGSVLWNSPTLLDCHPALQLLNHVICHTLCADWLALRANVVIVTRLKRSTIHHAFTHQVMISLSRVSTPIPACLMPCLISKLHLFHVCTGVIRSRVVPCLGEGWMYNLKK